MSAPTYQQMATEREKAAEEYALAKRKRGPGPTEDERSAGLRLDMRTAITTRIPTRHQFDRHLSFYGPECVGYCQALYARISSEGMRTPE
jgi:hypothetical protein